jgi:hypothetical protein
VTHPKLDRLKQLALAKFEEARQHGMKDDDEIDGWVVNQLKDKFADPTIQAALIVEFAALPDEPDDDEYTKQQRTATRRIVNDARKAIARKSQSIARRLRP